MHAGVTMPLRYHVTQYCSRKSFGYTRLDSLCTYTLENLEFLDTPVHIHVHMATTHEYKTVLIASVRGFAHVSFVQNVTHVRFSVVGLVNF